MKIFADQIRAFVPKRNFMVLGTDGFGRSDTRKKAARLLRGGPSLRRGGRAEGAGRSGRSLPRKTWRSDQEVRHRSRQTRTRQRFNDAADDAHGRNAIEVKVPDIGDFKNVPVIEVLVKPGDTVKAEDPLVTLETDKATMDVPSPVAGVVKEVRVKVGDKVSEGVADADAGSAAALPQQPAARRSRQLAAAAAAPQPAAAPHPAELRAGAAAAPPQPSSTKPAFGKAHASPSVRRFARELGVDLSRVKGSGPKERVLKEDVQNFVKGELARPRGAAAGGGLGFKLPPLPPVDFAKFGPVETQPLSRIKKISGANLHRNWVTIPHVTQFDEADITELEAFRKGQAEEAQKQRHQVHAAGLPDEGGRWWR